MLCLYFALQKKQKLVIILGTPFTRSMAKALHLIPQNHPSKAINSKSLPSEKGQALRVTFSSQAIIALREHRRSYGFASLPLDRFALNFM